MFRAFTPWALGLCLVSINLLFVMLAMLFGRLPAIIDFLRRLLRWILLVSFRLYYALLSRLQPTLENSFGLNLSSGAPRIIACSLLSLAILTFFLAITSLSFSVWGLAVAVLHGIVVGIVWEDALEIGSLHLGSRLR